MVKPPKSPESDLSNGKLNERHWEVKLDSVLKYVQRQDIIIAANPIQDITKPDDVKFRALSAT